MASFLARALSNAEAHSSGSTPSRICRPPTRRISMTCQTAGRHRLSTAPGLGSLSRLSLAWSLLGRVRIPCLLPPLAPERPGFVRPIRTNKTRRSPHSWERPVRCAVCQLTVPLHRAASATHFVVKGGRPSCLTALPVHRANTECPRAGSLVLTTAP